MIIAPAYASIDIENVKPVGVKKEIFVKVLSDLRNFKEIFPAFIKSVELKPDSNLATFTIEAGGTHQADARSSFQPDGKYVVEILSGDLKGTKFIISLTERVGFDGTPNGATTVKTHLFLEASGMASVALVFYGSGEISTAIGDGMYNLGEYAKRKYPISQNQNDVVQKETSASQIKSEKKVSTKELGIVKKTDLKKEAAQKLNLKKEAEKKLKQKDTGYGISEKQKSDLEKQIQTSKEKVEKTTKQKEGGYAGVGGGGKTNLEEQLELAKRKVEQATKVVIPRIVLDPLPSSVNAGSIVTFSGTLYLSEIPQGAIVYIKEEDPFDSDDLLAGAYVQSNGKFSVKWMATNVDADKVADIYAVFEGSYPHYPRLTTCGSDCTNTIKLRIN